MGIVGSELLLLLVLLVPRVPLLRERIATARVCVGGATVAMLHAGPGHGERLLFEGLRAAKPSSVRWQQ